MSFSLWNRRIAGSLVWIALLAAAPAHASFLSGDALDAAADVIAIVVLIVVPIVVIVVFWLLHVMPERLAEKRHHPQTAAIQTLCLLSLVFGGLLWPLAWLWAFTKPVAYRVAYGTDKSEDWHMEMGEKAKAGTLLGDELAHLRAELDAMERRGALPPNLRQLRADLLQLAATHATKAATLPAAAPSVETKDRA
jgi:CBS domain containing-hemolysin-like protein